MISPRQKQRRRAGGVLLALLLAAGVVVAFAPRHSGEYHPATFCPKDGQYARTAILIDATDSLDDAQIKSATERAADLIGNRLAVHEWTGVFVLDEENLILPSPRIALCNPGGGDECNPLFANCRDAAREFDEKFAAPVAAEIRALAGLPPDDRSPILEMIRAVSLDGGFDSTRKRRLIIVSDMLQNTPAYSHYGGDFNFSEWQKSDYARDFLRLPLAETEVEIWYVKRAGLEHLQTHGHIEFWNQYFAATGARVVLAARL